MVGHWAIQLPSLQSVPEESSPAARRGSCMSRSDAGLHQGAESVGRPATAAPCGPCSGFRFSDAGSEHPGSRDT